MRLTVPLSQASEPEHHHDVSPGPPLLVLPGADNASAACLATEKVVAVLEYVPYKMRAADLHAVRVSSLTRQRDPRAV